VNRRSAPWARGFTLAASAKSQFQASALLQSSSKEDYYTFRKVSLEHWFYINRDPPRHARDYSKENQTRLLSFDFKLSQHQRNLFSLLVLLI